MAVLFSWHNALSFPFQLPLKQTMRLPWHNANFSALHSILRLWLCHFQAQGHFFGLKATFPGTKPLLRAQGNFYGSKATFLGTKPLSLALHSVLRLWLCCFLAQGHFLSITNAVYGHNAVFLGAEAGFPFRAQSHWHMAISFLGSKPLANGHFFSITNAIYGH